MENEKSRAKRLMDGFKLTIEKWERVNSYQGGVCALCGRSCHTGKRLATDHSHLDGLFRGLLCAQCNPILGKLENAWVRLGMHKQTSVTFVEFVSRLLGYVQAPPATTALGYEHFGYPGKVNTKKHRLMLRRLAKEKQRKSVP
jgi:hypothetical protein